MLRVYFHDIVAFKVESGAEDLSIPHHLRVPSCPGVQQWGLRLF